MSSGTFAADEIEWLAFDVGGTVVDWHGGVSAGLADYGRKRQLSADWPALTNAWRERAMAAILGARTIDLPDGNIDGVHRATLDDVLATFELEVIPESDRDALTWLWHSLDPWPDAVGGHARLRSKYLVSTLTMLSVRLVADISRRAPFHWDAIISCEMLDAYKFDPIPYREAPRLLQTTQERVLMIATHDFDLRAAHEQGLRTAYVTRPAEWGQPAEKPAEAPGFVDLVAADLIDLAEQLGC